jgi:hypothetical protein
MSLPVSQQRALDEIEKTLADDHPGLGPLFATFTSLVGHEAMPVTERVTAWRSRWRRRISPTIATLVGLAVAAVALFTISLTLPSSQVCPSTVIAAGAHVRSVSTGHEPACAIQPIRRTP